MNLITKTVYFNDLAVANLRGKKYTPMTNTTLNEKFSILSELENTDVPNPVLKYFCLGVGNLATIDSDQDLGLYFGNHKVTDGALYQHIPFIMRLIEEDLGPDDRRKYRLRKEVSVDGLDYIAYYLKVIPDDKVDNQILMITKETDTAPKMEPYTTADASILEPIATENRYLIDDYNTKYLVNSDQITLELTYEELIDIKDAMEILNIEEPQHVLNELALVTGSDYLDMSDYSLEVINSQISFFLDIDYDIQMLIDKEQAFSRQVEIGGMEPIQLT